MLGGVSGPRAWMAPPNYHPVGILMTIKIKDTNRAVTALGAGNQAGGGLAAIRKRAARRAALKHPFIHHQSRCLVHDLSMKRMRIEGWLMVG